MLQKPTDELDHMLESTEIQGIDSYLRENQKYMASGEKIFSDYMKELYFSKHMKLTDVYMKCGFSQSYGEHLLDQSAHTNQRDYVLRFCLVGQFTLEETNRALKLYGMKELYSKDPRDAILIVAIHQRSYDPEKLDALLLEHGFEGVFEKQNT